MDFKLLRLLEDLLVIIVFYSIVFDIFFEMLMFGFVVIVIFLIGMLMILLLIRGICIVLELFSSCDLW